MASDHFVSIISFSLSHIFFFKNSVKSVRCKIQVAAIRKCFVTYTARSHARISKHVLITTSIMPPRSWRCCHLDGITAIIETYSHSPAMACAESSKRGVSSSLLWPPAHLFIADPNTKPTYFPFSKAVCCSKTAITRAAIGSSPTLRRGARHLEVDLACPLDLGSSEGKKKS